MTRFRGVIEFVRFVTSILKMRFNFYLIVQNSHQLETIFFNKIANRTPNYKHIPISTLIIQLMNFTDYYLTKQLVQYVTSCLLRNARQFVIESLILLFDLLFVIVIVKMLLQCCKSLLWLCKQSSLLLLLILA